MKKINPLMLLFWLFAVFCLGAAVAAPDRGQMVSGLIRICTQPVYTLTNFFAPGYGGYAGAFFNTALVALLCILIYSLPGAAVNDGSVVAFFLTVGLTARGTTVLNFLLGIPGVLLYCLVKKQRPGVQANAMVFASGVSLLFTELLLYYPGDAWHGVTAYGVAAALAGGCLAGFLTAGLMAWNVRWDTVLSLYTASLPVGIVSILLNALLYQIPGIPRPVVEGIPNTGSWMVSWAFLIPFFLLCILAGRYCLGGSREGYGKLLRDRRWNVDYSLTYGVGNIAINLGCLGLISVVYYTLVGARWDAVTFGSVLCMVCTCCRGCKPSNVWPLLLGYLLAGYTAIAFTTFAGTPGVLLPYAPGLITGASFVVGLAPIVSRYGWKAGLVCGGMHYGLVTTILPVTGTFCMYHGGFTAAFVSLLMVPVLNHVLDHVSAA